MPAAHAVLQYAEIMNNGDVDFWVRTTFPPNTIIVA